MVLGVGRPGPLVGHLLPLQTEQAECRSRAYTLHPGLRVGYQNQTTMMPVSCANRVSPLFSSCFLCASNRASLSESITRPRKRMVEGLKAQVRSFWRSVLRYSSKMPVAQRDCEFIYAIFRSLNLHSMLHGRLLSIRQAKYDKLRT
jgi:hypothetical protein